MKTPPKVSVIMPAYNAEAYIREAVDSILAQTYSDFELIILDDGSKDSTADIIESYNDPRIRLVKKDNEGVAATLNRGIQLAQGEFIWRHDADDTSTTSRLEMQVSFMNEHPAVILCATQIAFMTERGKIAKNKRQPKSKWFDGQSFKWVQFEDFDPFSPITHATILAKTHIIKQLEGYRTAFPTSEDIDLWMRMLAHGPMAVLNECTYHVRLSKTSATAVHGWKNEFYRERAKDFWRQRQLGGPDDLEIKGTIDEPPPPKILSSEAPKKGKIVRSDLLNFHLAVHVDARDWLEVSRIIRIALADGWRMKSVYKSILISLAPEPILRSVVRFKKRIIL